MKKSLVVILILILVSIFVFTIYRKEPKSDVNFQKEKTLADLEYVETSILSMIEKYLKEDYEKEKEKEIDWDLIKEDYKNISESSVIIVLDLTNFQVENENILKFETAINSLNSSISNNNEETLLENLKNLYKLIPDYIEKISPENNNLYLEVRAKVYLLESFYYSTIDDFSTSLTFIEKAEEIYKNFVVNQNYLNSYKINRIYVAIQEMKVCIQNMQKENVKGKYINTF